VIANAPEQWMAIFFPIWPDVEAELAADAAGAATDQGTDR
jgi:hypothetical protein